MFRKLIKNKKAQNTAEYALLIALVVAAIIAMQTYAQRALQARVRDASSFLTSLQGGGDVGNYLGNTAQYEPYYLETEYTVTTSDTDTQTLIQNTTRQEIFSNTLRATGGSQVSTYDNSLFPGGF